MNNSGRAVIALVMISIAAMAIGRASNIAHSPEVTEKMAELRAREIARNIELVSSYNSPGYVRKNYGDNLSFRLEEGSDTPTKLYVGFTDVEKSADVGVHLEPQNYGQEFSTDTLCIRQDAWRRPMPWSSNDDGQCIDGTLDFFFGSFQDPVCELDDRVDIEDDNDGLEFGYTSTPNEADEYVQVYKAGEHGGSGKC